MSLHVDSHGHSRSRSRDRRSWDDGEPDYVYPEHILDDPYGSGRRRAPSQSNLAFPGESAMDGQQHGYYDDGRRPASRSGPDGRRPPEDWRHDDRDRRARAPEAAGSRYDRRSGGDDDEEARIRRAEPPRDMLGMADHMLRFLPQKYSRKSASNRERDEQDLAYGPAPPPPRSPRPDSSASATYATYAAGPGPAEQPYARYGRDDNGERRRSRLPDDGYGSRQEDSYYRPGPSSAGPSSAGPSSSAANVLTVDGSRHDRDRRRDRSPGPASLAVESGRRDRSRDRSRERQGGARDRSPNPPTARMSSLTVDTGRSSNLSLASAPASPLLESYRGTYQDCSPMPSPLLLASRQPADVEALSPLNSDAEAEAPRSGRRARFHDPEDIASSIAHALKGDGPPDTEPLVEILPSLTHEQVMELRVEYKRLVKTGSDRKGVNVAKHIRARLKDDDANLMKACYAVALGRWESEAYWANFWYQGDKTRRELLIESLMGRTNSEIRRIKEAFADKKYDNSLTKCMKTELKEDKFKKAVLMVLDERRMEDVDPHGRRIAPDRDLVLQDVADLRHAVKADKGGESAMIAIVVRRSDDHLHAVLQEYERHYHANFAREALKRSGNLVGELLAHILNGVINRPVRDALLLHHALSASRRDGLRRELLVSRLVRFHWDPAHMRAVKAAFRDRYGRDLGDAVRDAAGGQLGRFCAGLCIARVPNDVRRVERVLMASH